MFEGLDTVATVTLNGSELGRTKNQHRSYRFDLRSTIRARGNELVVDFQSPLRAARASEERIGAKPLVADALPYNALRKMACNFGWDWGPTLTTSGIWKPISVHQWSTARIASVVPQVTVLPHISGPTNRQTAAAIVAANIRRYRAAGALPTVVDKQRRY